MLARQKNKAQFEHSVKFGKVGPIEIKGGNVKDWVARGKTPDDLILTTTKGKHSDKLKAMSDSRERIETLTVSSVVGENTIMVITFSNARIKGYTAGEDKTEDWKVVDFDAVHRESTSIGAARP